MKKKIKFEKMSDKAKIPTRGTVASSGLDFYSPVDVTIKKGADAKIPLDLMVELPLGFDMLMNNKSGRATKNKLIVGAELIDSDYRGNIHAHLFNLGKEDVKINAGEKIVQGVIREVCLFEPYEAEIKSSSDRGSGGFGSTGLK